MQRLWILVLVLTIAFCGTAFAGSVFEKVSSDDYLVKAPTMLARGVTHVATSGVDILEHGYTGTRDGKLILGTLEGLGRGTLFALDRAGRGFLDVGGFLVPGYRGSPSTHEHEFKLLNF